MKVNGVRDGQFANIQLGNGRKVFLSVLPDRITASYMFWFFPTKEVWEFIFPFYIRTSAEAWESSVIILQKTIEGLAGAEDEAQLNTLLRGKVSKKLRSFIEEQGDDARNTSVDKVGVYAFKPMTQSRDLDQMEKIVNEYGKIMELTSIDTPSKYPALVYPKSLLPYPKEEIKKALENYDLYVDDAEAKELLKIGLLHLEGYIDDEEANQKNQTVLKALGKV